MKLSELGPLIGSSLKAGADALADIYAEHAPRIWTGVCVTGVIFLPFMSAKAMLRSIQAIEAKEKELGRSLTRGEKLKECWKCWIGTAMAVGISAGSAIVSLEESEKRLALMATGIQVLSEANKTDILNKVEDVAGKKKRDEVANRLADEEVKNIDPNTIQHTKFGNDWWLEKYTGTSWYGDTNSVERAWNAVTARVNNDETVAFQEFFDNLGIETDSVLRYLYLKKGVKIRYPSIGRLSTERVCNVVSFSECPFEKSSIVDLFNLKLSDFERYSYN